MLKFQTCSRLTDWWPKWWVMIAALDGVALAVQKTDVTDLSAVAELMCSVQKAVMWHSTTVWMLMLVSRFSDDWWHNCLLIVFQWPSQHLYLKGGDGVGHGVFEKPGMTDIIHSVFAMHQHRFRQEKTNKSMNNIPKYWPIKDISCLYLFWPKDTIVYDRLL